MLKATPAAVAAALLIIGSAQGAPCSMLHTMPECSPKAKPGKVTRAEPVAQPRSYGMGWMTKWFAKPESPVPQTAIARGAQGADLLAHQPAPAGATIATPAPSDALAEEVKAIRRLGHEEDSKGNLAGAEQHYRRAISVDPNSAAAVNDLGLCLARQGRLEESAEQLRLAIAMRPEKALYRNNIATVLVELDETDEALGHLGTSYPLAVAQHNLGCLLARSGKVEQAKQQLRGALRIAPDLTPAAELLAELGGDAEASPASTPLPGSVANRSAVTPPPAAQPAPTSSFGKSESPRLAAAPVATAPAASVPQPGRYSYVEPEAPTGEPATIAPSFPRLLPPVLDR